jgi:D-beta-D-heptose 7-phosphate kinase / D-beta-D-heptose 1-phosphate adenosyltransferase
MQQEDLISLLSGFHRACVLVLGDVMLDRFVYGSVERISPEAPIPVVAVERSMDMPGGAANVARNVAAMGARAILLGVVGEDAAAQDLRSQLASLPSIDAHLVRDASRPTTVKTRYVADGQQVMRADRESCAALCTAVERHLLDRFVEVLDQAGIIVLSDYAKGVLSDSMTRAVIDIARGANKTIIVDPKDRDLAKYRGASILTPNRLELQAACGHACLSEEQLVDGARRVLEQGVCGTLVVTRGKDGMSVIGPGDLVVHLPGAARQVFDVSGAGDTVVAAIALGLACGGRIVDASRLANIAAGIAVGKRGTATVSPGEIIAELSPFDGRADTQKIFSLDSVLQLVRAWREQGLKIAFTNGCFDLLHPGHISLLEQARRAADRLIVGLNADLSIRRLKGPGRPVQSEAARATVLGAVKSVDAVVIFSEDTPAALIERLEPDVLVKGADYTLDTVVGADFVLARGGKVLLAQLLPGHSTTDTVKRVATSSAP